MKKYNYLMVALVCSIALGVTSCNEDEEVVNNNEKDTLTIELDGLSDVGDNFAYEGWIIVDGAPISAGIFNVDENGNPDKNTFELDADNLAKATAYVLTIEPSPDADLSPSKVHILAGEFNGNSSELLLSHPSAIGTDFTQATGSYLLGTPTDGSLDTDETSGIWWENLDSGAPIASLNLPTLPEGWEYEGWVVIDGQPVTTGKFLNVDEADFEAPFSGSESGPPFPGEDFLVNAPDGLTFPLNLSGKTTVISVEPSPDNSPNPFLLKPLVHVIPADANFHTSYQMENMATSSNPTGTISKN